MNPRFRKILALAIPFLALALMQCGEKEGSLDPTFESEPPQYTITTLTVDKARIEPGEESTITVVVEDRQELPVAGYELDFTVTNGFGTIEAGGATNAEGVATATYQAPSMTGVAEIAISAPDLITHTVHIQVGQGILMADPVSILADGLSTSAVFLTLVDGNGTPIGGAAVDFSLSPETGMIYPAETETDSTGYAQATYYSEAGVFDETVTVEAKVTYDGSDYTELVNIRLRGVTMTLDADPQAIPADGVSTSMITARLKETTSGVPVTGAGVTFGTTLGDIGASAVTDDDGYGNVYLLSGTTAGQAAVSAEYGGFLIYTSVSFGELQLSVRPYLEKMVADGVSSQMIEATLLTEDNTPVSGVDIDFSTTAGIIAGEGRTNLRGKAKALLTSSDAAATATVGAEFSGVTRTVQVAFENPVVMLKTSPVTITASPSKASQITAYVSFADGTPVPDSTSVLFGTTQGTITGLGLTRSGLATAELRPSGVAADDVTITAQCGHTTATAHAVFIADGPANVLVTATPAAIAGGGGAFSTIVAEVTDFYGNPVVDGTPVTFTVTSGTGIVTPSALTSSGIATARFVPTGGGLATVRACSGTNCADAGVAIMSGEAGTITADPDTAWISVAGTGTGSAATIVAHVYDSNAVPVENGTEVTFEIAFGPGGGEYLDHESAGYGPVVRETTAGMASIAVIAGTKPGTILLSITAGDYAATTAKVGIASGPPDSILIGFGEIAVNADGTYTLGVSAIVRDKYMNPVENGTAVYFTIDRPDIGFINPETYTGADFPCAEQAGVPIKGVSRACLTYPSTSTFETVEMTAATSGGLVESYEVSSMARYTLPIVDGEIALQAIPGTVSGTAGGSCAIYVTVGDHYVRGLDNIPVLFSVDGEGSVSPYTAVTDNTGMPLTTLTVAPGTAPGKTKVKAKIWMVDVEGEVEVTVTE